MNIVNANLQFIKPLEPILPNHYDAIALHHIDSDTGTLYDVHQWHLANGWVGCGYGYFVALDGTVYEGRGLFKNAGVQNENGHVLSIAFQGNYNSNRTMPVEQFLAGVDLVKYLKTQLPMVTTIEGHKFWNSTSCPGDYFPLEQIKEAITMVDREHWAEKYFAYLIENGFLVNDRRFDDNVTRGEMMRMVALVVARIKGEELF